MIIMDAKAKWFSSQNLDDDLVQHLWLDLMIIAQVYRLSAVFNRYEYGTQDPTTWVLGFASYPGFVTWDLYSYWGRWHNMATRT